MEASHINGINVNGNVINGITNENEFNNHEDENYMSAYDTLQLFDKDFLKPYAHSLHPIILP